jgi:hypothetical protein
MAEKDPTFKVVSYSCFGPDGQSAWPERRSTDELLKEKQGYINRNLLSVWLAEMECQLISSEAQAFQKKWLKYWQVYPGEGRCLIVADPASSEEKDADFFAIAVLLFFQRKIYLLEYSLARGMMPDAACAKIFDFAERYGAREVVVETVAYQKIMAWYLRKEIEARRFWLTIHEVRDKRRKDDRIVQSFTQVAPYGNFLIGEGMTDFEEVFELYGPGYKGKVDLLDACALGITHLLEGRMYQDDVELEAEFRRIKELDEPLDNVNDEFQGAP